LSRGLQIELLCSNFGGHRLPSSVSVLDIEKPGSGQVWKASDGTLGIVACPGAVLFSDDFVLDRLFSLPERGEA
jgi:hypothetical protein